MNPLAFVTEVFPAIRKAIPAASREVHRMVLAHAALETGWGEAKAFLHGRNLFNITRSPDDSRPVVEGPDLEYSKSGVRRITQRFAAYDTYGESVEHYLRFINRDRYRPALEQLLNGDVAFVVTLGQGRPRKPEDGRRPLGGYYTLPVHEYVRRFESVLKNVRVLVSSEEDTQS